MKRLTKRASLIILLGAFLIAVAPLTGIADKQAQIQIGTYNLEFFTDLNPSTGAWCEEHNHRTLPQIKALASFIDSLDIEVLALQEVEDAAALDLLLKYMPTGKYAYIISHQQGLCQRVAVLYQPKKVSLTYKGEIPLSLGHAGLRNGLVVYGKVLPNGFDFTLVVVHLKAYFDSKSTATREQQLKLLGNWVSNYLKDKNNDPDLILAGDFNEHLLTDRYAFSLLDQDLGLKDLDQDVPDKTCTPDGRYYSDPIDHIIISPNAENEYEGTTTLDNYFTNSTLSYRESYSDHCIMWSDFSTLDLDGAVQTPTTPAGKIATTMAHVVINEVEQNPPGKDTGNEWVELYNQSDSDIDIGGWTLETTHGRTVTLWIPQGTVISAHGYSVWGYSRQWLDNKDEMVILKDSSGREIDRTPMLNDTHNDNQDWQRCPNGQDTDSPDDWRLQPSTEGKSNNC